MLHTPPMETGAAPTHCWKCKSPLARDRRVGLFCSSMSCNVRDHIEMDADMVAALAARPDVLPSWRHVLSSDGPYDGSLT